MLSEDTEAGDLKNPLSLNKYTYCYNNPIRFVDMSGNQPTPEEVGRTLAYWLIGNPLNVWVTQHPDLASSFTGLPIVDAFHVAGFFQDTGGVWHTSPNAPQQVGGYNDFYDTVFYYATSMDKASFPFISGGRDYNLWAWKGNYLNLGAGAELGIYSNESGILGLVDVHSPNANHWLVDTNLAMRMTLTLKDKNNNIIFNYQPRENEWWITGFNPYRQGVQASDLTAYYTVTFSNRDMYNDFYNIYGQGTKKDPRWTFDPKTITAAFKF